MSTCDRRAGSGETANLVVLDSRLHSFGASLSSKTDELVWLEARIVGCDAIALAVPLPALPSRGSTSNRPATIGDPMATAGVMRSDSWTRRRS